MNNNNSEEPKLKKRKSTTHKGSTTFKTDASSGDMDSFDNDIVIRFASYLCSRDLVSLALTCRRFGFATKHDKGLSLMEDTAHQIICNAKEDEREALPKLSHQSYIELYSELEKYREPRLFDQLIGNSLSYVNDDKSHIKIVRECSTPDNSTAISDHVMRAGRHYATFTKEGGWVYQYFNELRQERTDSWGDSTVHYCSLAVGSREFHNNGRCFWCDWLKFREINDWGCSEAFENSDEIGMVLDLDAGTLCVYKNGRRLGIMKDGLSGDYCWAATIWSHGEGVSIKKGTIPPI